MLTTTKRLLFIFTLLLQPALAACGGEDLDQVPTGRWIYTGQERGKLVVNETLDQVIPADGIEIGVNGRVLVWEELDHANPNFNQDPTVRGSWIIVAGIDQMIFQMEVGPSDGFRYTFSGRSLTLTDATGKSKRYRKP